MSTPEIEIKKQLKDAELDLQKVTEEMNRRLSENPKFKEDTANNAKTISTREEEILQIEISIQRIKMNAEKSGNPKDFEDDIRSVTSDLENKQRELKKIRDDMDLIERFNATDKKYKEIKAKGHDVPTVSIGSSPANNHVEQKKKSVGQFVPEPTKQQKLGIIQKYQTKTEKDAVCKKYNVTLINPDKIPLHFTSEDKKLDFKINTDKVESTNTSTENLKTMARVYLDSINDKSEFDVSITAHNPSVKAQFEYEAAKAVNERNKPGFTVNGKNPNEIIQKYEASLRSVKGQTNETNLDLPLPENNSSRTSLHR